MARPPTLVAAALALCLVLAPSGLAWYKHAAGSGFHSVGRAAGLLSSFRRAQYARRSEPPVAPPGRAGAFPELRPRLRSPVSADGGDAGAGGGGRWGARGLRGAGGRKLRRGGRQRESRGAGRPSATSRPQTVCIRHVTPHLHSCERLPDGRATFQCKADVSLSLRAAGCRSV